ncbi:DNA (cytosine-5-)-methyltransferase [Lysinibacillus sphaericus]|uniref:Cytosine-specific methyltransferase n=2 Tax=Lysinibacillus sphaericus TaxID=1421 RepID=A0A2S0K6V0_LYSSH|nr:DNA (cytosine-5-)-methyltransferase [Lysinibacillus sphaericus]TKI17608.1 DNA (cytosine-5-)-methyltransferase [Lysinibacillus sphaericus]SUV18649.1 Modification methylase [Lysinibacillus sphaericus]
MKQQGINTQKELAVKLNISENQLSMMLSKSFNPIKANAINLCEVLNVKLEDIFEETQITLELDVDQEVETVVEEEEGLDASEFEGHLYSDIRNILPLRPYTVVELFAGAGGLALGLEQAGFHSLGLVEQDKHACKTLRDNRPNYNVIEEDIEIVAEKGIENYIDIPEGGVDLLSGGYPCQSFSYAGKKGGLSDTRGTLFYSYAQILRQLMPKMFLAENVKGLVTDDGGKTLSLMIRVFSEIGYTIQWKVLNALDYDTAQKRQRIFIIGIRNDLLNTTELTYAFPERYGYQLTLRDILKDVPKSDGESYSATKAEVLKLVPPGGYWRDLPEEVAKTYMGKSYYSTGGRTGMARRLSWDEPSLTLTCSPAQKQTERCHPDETRPFTVREYARIQGFPDSWEFNCSNTNAYKQIGNAVPVSLAKAVGLSIVRILNEINN